MQSLMLSITPYVAPHQHYDGLENKEKPSFPLPKKTVFLFFAQENKLSFLDNNQGQLNNETQLNDKGQLNSKGQLIKNSSDVFLKSRPKAGKLAY